MAVLEVIKYGHPTLRVQAKPCQKGDISSEFVNDLIQTMYAEDGVGLAATQVNVAKQILVARDPDTDHLYVLVNPQIVAFSEKTVVESEGCLSLPKLQAEVERAHKIEVKAQDPEGRAVYIKAKEMFARVLQHEIDHLHGVLYIDRADLSTLCRLEAKDHEVDEPELQKVPVTLAEIQERYRELYHQGLNKVVFDPAV
jgi:peptide deformylase